ncbi:MAG: hypothetical protein O2960_03000 [Verrucomicrobia bacterium]|nr:hypothetical protein [Verrucomicrobiota bacterium]
MLAIDGTENRIDCGFGEWIKGRGGFGRYRDEPIAASGAWTDDNTFVARVCAYETPFYMTIKLRFDGDQLVHEAQTNVGFGSKQQGPLIGKLAGP